MLDVWDATSGAHLESVVPPWRTHDDFAPSWASAIVQMKFRGAKHVGGIWVLALRDQVVFVGPQGQWQAHWHGIDIESPGFSGASHFLRSGRHLIFTQLMQGRLPWVQSA
jgi:hypothetical protein